MATATVTLVITSTVTAMASSTRTGRPRYSHGALMSILGPFFFATALSCLGFGFVLVQALQYFRPTTHHYHMASCKYSPAHRLQAIDADQVEVPWSGFNSQVTVDRGRERDVEAGNGAAHAAGSMGESKTTLRPPDSATIPPASPLTPQHDAYPHSPPLGLRHQPSISSLIEADPFRRGSAATLLLDFPPAHPLALVPSGPAARPAPQVSCPIRRRLRRWDKASRQEGGETVSCKGFNRFRKIKWMPVLVAFLLLVNMLLTCFDLSRSVKMFIYSAGMPSNFFRENHFENGVAALLGLIPAAATQIFLLRRCLLFMRHLTLINPHLGHRYVRWSFAAVAGLSIFIAFVTGTLGQAMVVKLGSQAEVTLRSPHGVRFQRLESTCFIASAFVDLLLSATLCTELYWAKIGTDETNVLLSRLIYVTFQGGVLAASMQIATCVLLVASPKTGWANVLWYILPKVYFSTMLMSIIKTCECPQGITTVGSAAAPVDITGRRDSAIDMQYMSDRSRSRQPYVEPKSAQSFGPFATTSFRESLRQRAGRIRKASGRQSPAKADRRNPTVKKGRPTSLRTEGHQQRTDYNVQLQNDSVGAVQSGQPAHLNYTFPPKDGTA